MNWGHVVRNFAVAIGITFVTAVGVYLAIRFFQSVVIVVDDDPGYLKSVARLLAQHGIDSRTFASAETLLESDSVQTATCLLLAIHRGGISGMSCSGVGVTRRRAMKRWTPGASPICASRSRSMSC